MKDRVKDKYGLPYEDVVLFASHNHAGPALVEPPENGRPADLARDAFQNNVAYTKNLEDSSLAWSARRSPGWSRRAYPTAWAAPTLP